jgi:MFS family permease
MTDTRKNVTLSTMVLLNIINFGLVAFWSFDGAAMPLFLTAKFGLSNFTISVLLGIGKFMIVLSMVFGLFTDAMQYRWGKRRPLMLAGTLICAPLIALIPHLPTVWLLVPVLTVIYFGIQFAAVPYFALVPEVVPNEKLGTANAFFSVFGGVGTIVAYMVLLSVVYKVNKPMAFHILAVTHLLCTIATVLSIKETLPEKPPEKIKVFKVMIQGARDGFRSLPSLPSFTGFMLSNLMFWMALGAFVVYFTKFMEYYANIPGTTAGMVLGAIVVISVLLAVPVGMLADKYSRKMINFVGMLLIFAGLLVDYFAIGPTSSVSGVNLSDSKNVAELAKKQKVDMTGAELSLFVEEQFSPAIDLNKDEMTDKKSDAMRWCLNGELDEKGCREAVQKVLGDKHPALEPTTTALVGLSKYIKKETSKVLILSYLVISFAAIGLTTCFVIMAAILPTLMPEDKMGLFMGFYSSVTGIGQFLSLILAGLMIDLTLGHGMAAFGYRWIFVQGVFFILIAALTLLRVPYIPNAKDPTATELMKQGKKSV